MKRGIIAAMLFSTLIGCGGVDIGNSSKASEDDNSVDIDIAQGSDTGATCPASLLWKPISESDGKLVILFDEAFDEEFEAVTVTDLEGTEEQGVFSGFTNGNRQTWRFPKEGAQYTGVVEIQTEGESCTVVVSEPGERND